MPCTITDTVQEDDSERTDSKHPVQAGCSPDREAGDTLGGEGRAVTFPRDLFTSRSSSLHWRSAQHGVCVCVLSWYA